jgi:chromosome partitioning protein
MTLVEAREDEPGVWTILKDQLAKEVELRWELDVPAIVAVYSEKGGVGKTGTTAGLVATMAAAGGRVLAIDLDPRGTLTAELAAKTTGDLGVNDLLYIDTSKDPDTLPPLSGMAQQALRPAGEAWGPNVAVLAAGRSLANRENDPLDIAHRLRVSLEGVAEQFHLVAIDMPPRAGTKLTSIGLHAATHILYVTTLSTDGIIGVTDAKQSVKYMQQTAHRKWKEVGVLRNIVGRRTQIAAHHDQQLRGLFGKDLLPFAVAERVVRAETRELCIPITAAQTPESLEVINGYTRVLNQIGRVA